MNTEFVILSAAVIGLREGCGYIWAPVLTKTTQISTTVLPTDLRHHVYGESLLLLMLNANPTRLPG